MECLHIPRIQMMVIVLGRDLPRRRLQRNNHQKLALGLKQSADLLQHLGRLQQMLHYVGENHQIELLAGELLQIGDKLDPLPAQLTCIFCRHIHSHPAAGGKMNQIPSRPDSHFEYLRVFILHESAELARPVLRDDLGDPWTDAVLPRMIVAL